MKASSSTTYFDTNFEIPAPEYILFRYSLAGPCTRLFAVLLDHAILFGLLLVSFLILQILFGISLFSGLEAAAGLFQFLTFMALFFLNWFYFLSFEWANRGRTPGKMALGIRVVSVDGTSLDPVQVMIRNLVRVADMFPMTITLFPSYVAGGLSAFLSGSSFQRLGDLAAGTIVVREQRPVMDDIPVEDVPKIRRIVSELHMRVFPSASLTQGLNDFVARRAKLNPARAQEIAEQVEPQVRRFFGAGEIDCNAVELLLAAHHYLYSMSREEFTGFALGRR